MDFLEALAQRKPLLLDGAMGTMLQASGMPVGVSPESYCWHNPSVVRRIHEQYIAAGSSLITTCTFGANPYKLDPKLDLAAFNTKMVHVAQSAREHADHPVYIAGNLGPSGQFVKPLGTIEPKDLIQAYVKQVEALTRAGVDLFLIETQFDLAEAKALVIAVRLVTDLPILVSMTFEAGLSLTGSTPEIFVETMDNLGVSCIGTNCSLGPDQMVAVFERMRKCTDTPLMVEPNAGLPELRGSETVFPLDAESYARKTVCFAQMGAAIIGGCCGTTPEYIAKLSRMIAYVDSAPKKQLLGERDCIVLTSRSKLVRIGANAPFCLIGERINPTGKKALTKELQSGSFEMALQFASDQKACGAAVFDVNVGAPLVDETSLLPSLTQLLVKQFEEPLSLDSSNAQALENALPYCPGSFLLNSISGEEDRLERLAPVCARYGAPFILLPMEGKKLPLTANERIRILESLLQRLDALGIARRLVIVDILALPLSANSLAAKACLGVLDWCTQNHIPTTIGLSNISFGLPARELINTNFVQMAIGAGLASCIANPLSVRLQEVLDTTKLFRCEDPHAESFIASYSSWSSTEGARKANAAAGSVQSLFDCVLLGDKDHVLTFVEKELAKGVSPLHVVQEILIPAITAVGEKYEKKEYFLPQLLRAAETMQHAFGYLKPMIEQTKAAGARPCIVLATVEGDIHDIGKNIVALLLSNHGFDVFDCGKDVPAKTIVACAKEHNAQLIGLSALMTTTMVKMKETIDLLREEKSSIKVFIGGAAVTQGFADAIGADAYCPDAVSAVREAKRLLGG